MFYFTTHSTHFIYGYIASDIWLRTILIVRKETRCRHIGYSYRLTARVLLYALSHRHDKTYHGLSYTSRGALAGTRNSSMGPPHEGSIAPWATSRSSLERSASVLEPGIGGCSIGIISNFPSSELPRKLKWFPTSCRILFLWQTVLIRCWFCVCPIFYFFLFFL